MSELLILTLILVAGVLFISFLMNRYAEFCYRVLVVDRMEQINAIIMSEEVPLAWRVPLLDSAARRATSPFWRKVRALLYAWYIYRLDNLSQHIRNSSYLKKDEKAEFLEAFAQIRQDWIEQGK